MRLPNGYGSIVRMKGNRRNPYRVRITAHIERLDNGRYKQSYKTLGYFKSHSEALQALSDYHNNPYDVQSDVTFSEVYQKWSEQHFEKIVPAARRTWISAYNHSMPLWSIRFADIRANHLEDAIRHADVGKPTKARMKSMYNLMFKYAIKNGIVEKNYASLCDSVKPDKASIERLPFTKEERELLWNNIHFPFVDMVLFGIYSGMRPQELCLIRTESIQSGYLIGGGKTEAGRDRIIPIHPLVAQIVEHRINEGHEYLFTHELNGERLTYDMYRRRFEKICRKFDMKHKPHDTRHTFITLAKSANMNEYLLKMIVGHSISDITEDVYTHRDISELIEEVKKIPR